MRRAVVYLAKEKMRVTGQIGCDLYTYPSPIRQLIEVVGSLMISSNEEGEARRHLIAPKIASKTP
tara:strand:+ start:439 stop:633 length:195 start_codon:yes stop_codon:yes gene_type:complete